MKLAATPVPDRDQVRLEARSLYWRYWGVTQIVDELNRKYGSSSEWEPLKRPTVESWKQRGKWDEAPSILKIESCLEARFIALVDKDPKSGGDYKEIDLLGRQIANLARVRRYQAPGGHEGDLNPKIENRNAGEKKKPRKNLIDRSMLEKLQEAFTSKLFQYQNDWRASSSLRTRFILKSRQIGATWYFAREALIHGLETGNNQIFISASRAQANIFRQYIVEFVQQAIGVKLEGDPIVVDRGEDEDGNTLEPFTLYFLGTNYKTAQGYHGDVYIDECFWIHDFKRLNTVASAMAMQKRYRKTYFSTPSAYAHQAYELWSGERFNKRRAKTEKAKFDLSHDALKKGAVGPDKVYRQIVTILDAEAGGCDLFDLDELRIEYSPDEFDLLLLCQFMDDNSSMFPFNLLRPCMVDSWDAWESDFRPFALRPFGDGEVWIGYDPQESAAGDDGACVVMAPPKSKGGKFRLLEKFRWKGLDFEEQAAKIIALLDRYNVGFIGIDTTGCGAAVWQLVVKKFPTARRYDYNVALKTAMVLKAKNVISNGRLEFDSGAIDIAQSFMAIQAELTASQRQVTYTASRAGDTGHADLAWAIMHVLFNEPLDGALGNKKASVETF